MDNKTMEVFQKIAMEETMEVDGVESQSKSTKVVHLLRRFLGVQQRRAEAYTKLRRYKHSTKIYKCFRLVSLVELATLLSIQDLVTWCSN
uniref:Uncharacterized protein n=1 Tax=Nelumbo nucifera TaxID=4432 RepID=A0A822YA51_NELNU|nr:TPA_asm: hypothetical protein HUJ06_030755 [Nelumbo nucifera]